MTTNQSTGTLTVIVTEHNQPRGDVRNDVIWASDWSDDRLIPVGGFDQGRVQVDPDALNVAYLWD